ncbi:hypothetical protein QFZ03_004545, partial [Escherichia coli]
ERENILYGINSVHVCEAPGAFYLKKEVKKMIKINTSVLTTTCPGGLYEKFVRHRGNGSIPIPD